MLRAVLSLLKVPLLELPFIYATFYRDEPLDVCISLELHSLFSCLTTAPRIWSWRRSPYLRLPRLRYIIRNTQVHPLNQTLQKLL